MSHTIKKITYEDGPTFYYRPTTSDEAIIAEHVEKRGPHPYEFPKDDSVKTIWDVGANIGVISVILARLYPNATIHAFEPIPMHIELLKMNAEPYKNIVIHEYGLDYSLFSERLDNKKNETQEVDFYLSEDPKNLGGISLYSSSEENKKNKIKGFINSIAKEVFYQSIPNNEMTVPDLLKLDCEGAEHEIIDFLCSADLKPKYILGEIHLPLFSTLNKILQMNYKLAFQKNLIEDQFPFYAVLKKPQA